MDKLSEELKKEFINDSKEFQKNQNLILYTYIGIIIVYVILLSIWWVFN